MLWLNKNECRSVIGNTFFSFFQGAYTFRPNSSDPIPFSTVPVKITVMQGPIVQEVRQIFGDWLTQTIRLYEDGTFLEMESTIGPIPVVDHWGKEVISKFSTSLNTKQLFYTDSNGMVQYFQSFVPNFPEIS